MKRFTSLILAVVMVLSLQIAYVNASEILPQEKDYSDKFVEMISDVYTGGLSAVKIIGHDGKDITQSFMENTIEYYRMNDWEAIHGIFAEEADYMVRETVEDVSAVQSERASDIAQTHYHEYMKTIYPVSGQSADGQTGRDLYFKSRAVIYFNESTGLISSTSGPYISEISIAPGENDYSVVSQTGKIASNKRSAAFSITLHIWFSDWIYIDYGNITDSFTVYPQ